LREGCGRRSTRRPTRDRAASRQNVTGEVLPGTRSKRRRAAANTKRPIRASAGNAASGRPENQGTKEPRNRGAKEPRAAGERHESVERADRPGAREATDGRRKEVTTERVCHVRFRPAKSWKDLNNLNTSCGARGNRPRVRLRPSPRPTADAPVPAVVPCRRPVVQPGPDGQVIGSNLNM
jgi:hypothetical protein